MINPICENYWGVGNGQKQVTHRISHEAEEEVEVS